MMCYWAFGFDGSGIVDVADLLSVVSGWGACDPGCLGDINGDDSIGTDDLLMVISSWGLCL